MLKNKYIQKILVSLCVVICIAAISCVMYFKSNIKDSPDVNNKVVAETEQNQTEKLKDISINIADHYITNTGDPGNLYTIDENNVLWGCGNNDWGQLAQGTRDYDVHNEKVKLAENVVHVDYSREGFAIYLTRIISYMHLDMQEKVLRNSVRDMAMIRQRSFLIIIIMWIHHVLSWKM